ncbi:peptidyl-prolyl cis-trans isomerase [Stappia sp. F7233]|uniref:Parvulin-like PPIase n=1 Tax=Stappia albiluteola TaxID=2758565 RepID=A0A839AHZ6_9HYPH|nr:peptidylprolyl isomerase [Stappia albiluteola]MBA5779470.1 peptidyl-prolyl cis-trans isomerase [Stappia albiluteola]
MATLYRNPSLSQPPQGGSGDGYTTKQEVDTRVPPKAAPVLAEISVNGVAIPESDILGEAQNHPARNPGEALRAAAEALVVRELLWQEAQRLNIAVVLACDETGRFETERDAAIRLLIEEAVHVPSATEEECRRFYDRNPEKFRSEPLYEARHILIAAAREDSETRAKARERAAGLCRLLGDQPERFGELAQANSDCPSREHGGNLGQLSRGSTVEEFETAVAAMAEGEISAAPVESRFGFHVIALDRKVEGNRLPFEFARERISAWLEASAWSRAVSQYISVLAGRARIEGISLKGADSPLVQ